MNSADFVYFKKPAWSFNRVRILTPRIFWFVQERQQELLKNRTCEGYLMGEVNLSEYLYSQ